MVGAHSGGIGSLGQTDVAGRSVGIVGVYFFSAVVGSIGMAGTAGWAPPASYRSILLHVALACWRAPVFDPSLSLFYFTYVPVKSKDPSVQA